MIIDPHVHLRGYEYPTFPYAEVAFRDCVQCGIVAVGEMPNPTPPLTSTRAIQRRKNLLEPLTQGVKHWINAGVTLDWVQTQGLMALGLPLKMFLTHSTANMGILDPKDQESFWRLARGWKGVVMQHCEDEKEWILPFDYSNPITHSVRQNPESELIQVERQLKFAKDHGFRGVFYVCHCSNPWTIDFLNQEAPRSSFEIIVEVTWHHMFLNYDDYAIHGNLVKMNPPLRSPQLQQKVLERVLRGNVQIIGSDHAPHPKFLKESESPPSGIPALPFWPCGIQKLIDLNCPIESVYAMTKKCAAHIFEIDVPDVDDRPYDPTLWNAYGWNPFSRVDHD